MNMRENLLSDTIKVNENNYFIFMLHFTITIVFSITSIAKQKVLHVYDFLSNI